jgi:hypothetical protein
MAEENEDGQGTEVETLTLSREDFNQAVRDAVAEEREQDQLALSRSRAEVRELRVERRIAKLQEQGHAPALLKVAEQIMLADETEEPVLSLSLEDGEKPLTATMIVEELLAAIPESALTKTEPEIRERADGQGDEGGDDFDKRINEQYEAMKSGTHLVA